MDNESKTIIVVLMTCLAAIGVGWMISSTLQPAMIEPRGPMTGGDDVEPTWQLGTEAIPWDEVIYVPMYPECEEEKMVLIDDVVKIEYENGTTVYHWLYTCEKAEINRTNIRVDATRLPDYELPS